ncbi:MAG: MBOAT family O-acyltransferase [Anaerolineae bacterium]
MSYLALFFLTLIPAVAAYWLLPRFLRPYILLLLSYAFYGGLDVRFALVLFGITLATYLISQQLTRSQRSGLWLRIGIIFNLGVLGILKYANFFLDPVASLGLPVPSLQLLQPLGLSFYSFQAISYLLELRLGKLPAPQPTFKDLALYLAFFPKLIAGPVIRPREFISQIEKRTAPLRRSEAIPALELLLIGLVKKVLIADSIASLADVAYRAAAGNSTAFASPLYLQGFYLYAFQIYMDFSGYTDMARGAALLLGLQLPENFRAPYFAATIADFWNRWHMSLTTWFRENLFIPLSRSLLRRDGNRHPRAVQFASNVITMTVIGFWHGASWTFVFWGFWNGLLVALTRLLNIKPTRRWTTILSAAITFHLVCIGWVFFRAPSFMVAIHFFQGLFRLSPAHGCPTICLDPVRCHLLVIAVELWQSDALPQRWHRYLGNSGDCCCPSC